MKQLTQEGAEPAAREDHGLRYHPLYRIWRAMKDRCYLPTADSYRFYGARGIGVCVSWQRRFTKFYNWATESGWKRGLQIDRIDPSSNYCPENCRWVTATDQQRNRKNSRLITINGETRHFLEWCQIAGISRGCLERRLKTQWPERLLLRPATRRHLCNS